jgi:adenylyltransferase/sulfurtransferase
MVFNHNGNKNLRDLFPGTKDVQIVIWMVYVGTLPGIIGTMMRDVETDYGFTNFRNELYPIIHWF